MTRLRQVWVTDETGFVAAVVSGGPFRASGACLEPHG